MGKKIDYRSLCEGALAVLKEIHKLATQIARFELSKPARAEVEEIIELSAKKRVLKEPYKEVYAQLMDDCVQIEDNLSEIEMVTGDLINQVNKLSPEAREAWFKQLGIENIPKEFEGLGEDLQDLLAEMRGLIEEVLEVSERYYSLSREDYVDFEEETGG